MNPIDQQIAIAESVGWTDVKPYKADIGRLWGYSPDPDPDFTSVPDYLNDLNAMHEVEKGLTAVQRTQFADILYNSMGKALLDWSGCYYPGEQPTIDLDVIFHVLHATASQRAEAYLRTINKWKD